MLLPSLLCLACRYQLSAFQSGLVVSTSLFGALAGSAAAFVVGDKLGRKRELLLAATLYGEHCCASEARKKVCDYFVTCEKSGNPWKLFKATQPAVSTAKQTQPVKQYYVRSNKQSN